MSCEWIDEAHDWLDVLLVLLFVRYGSIVNNCYLQYPGPIVVLAAMLATDDKKG